MDIQEIIQRYRDGYYKVPYPKNTIVPLDHVFDPTWTVAENRRMAEKNNIAARTARSEYRRAMNDKTQELRDDATMYIVNTYGLSMQAAKVVENKAWDVGHSDMYDYFVQVDACGEFAAELKEAL